MINDYVYTFSVMFTSKTFSEIDKLFSLFFLRHNFLKNLRKLMICICVLSFLDYSLLINIGRTKKDNIFLNRTHDKSSLWIYLIINLQIKQIKAEITHHSQLYLKSLKIERSLFRNVCKLMVFIILKPAYPNLKDKIVFFFFFKNSTNFISIFRKIVIDSLPITLS